MDLLDAKPAKPGLRKLRVEFSKTLRALEDKRREADMVKRLERLAEALAEYMEVKQ